MFGELEHLQIKTRLIDEMFASVMGEYVFLKSVCRKVRRMKVTEDDRRRTHRTQR